MQKNELLQSIASLRKEWKKARNEKLSRRDELLASGMERNAVRHDRWFRDLRKRQHGYAVRIIHLERIMNRKQAHEKKA